MRHWFTYAVAGAGFLALSACDLLNPVDPVRTPQLRPAAPAPQATSERSAALRQYLREVQSIQLSQGLLRQDGGGPDTPFSANTLARNFDRIVFFSE